MTQTFTKTQLAQYNGKIKPQKYVAIRSEERRVGKEGRSRWAQHQ